MATEWAKAILLDPRAIENPGITLVARMWRHKLKNGGDHGHANPYGRGKGNTAQQVPIVQNFYNNGSGFIGANNGSGSVNYDSQSPRASSSPAAQQLTSSQPDYIDPEVAVKAFFRWVSIKDYWILRIRDIEKIEEKFLELDYPLKVVLKTSFQTWKEYGFREGQWERFRRYCKQYVKEGRQL